jgi:hypothetical protein
MKKLGIIANSRIVLIFLLILGLLVVLELSSKGVVYFILGIEDNNYAHHYRQDPKFSLITWTDHMDGGIHPSSLFWIRVAYHN